MSEKQVVEDFAWTKTADKTIALRVNQQHRLIPFSYAFYNQVLSACRGEEAIKAIEYANLANGVARACKENVLFKTSQGWQLGNRPLARQENDRMDLLKKQNVPAVILNAVAVKLLDQSEEDVIITSPDQDMYSAEITFYGWLEYLRRFGSKTIDSVDDFNGNSIAVLAEGKGGRRVLMLSRFGQLYLHTEVDRVCDTIDQAMDWLLQVKPSVAERIVRMSVNSASVNVLKRVIG